MTKSKAVREREAAIARRNGQWSAGVAPAADPAAATDSSAQDVLLDTVTGSAEAMRAAVAEAAAHIETLPTYPLAAIAPHPDNPVQRIAVDAELIELGEDIATIGLQQPIVIAHRSRIEADDPDAADQLPDAAEWVLIMGHRRWAAGLHKGLDELPGLIRTGPCDPLSVAEIFLSENFKRVKPDPLMEADAYQRMKDAGLGTTVAVAQRRKVAQSHVSKTLKLRQLPADVAAVVRTGKLPRTDAYEYLALPEELRGPVFAKWQAGQQRADKELADSTFTPPTLRALARRAKAAATSTPKTQNTGATNGDPAPETETAPAAAEPAPAAGAAVPEAGLPWSAALRELQLTATVRAEILADALLCLPEGELADPGWRAPVAEALAIQLPEGPLTPDAVAQPVWRRIAVGRALWLLDRASAQHNTDGDAPAHVLRHRRRLTDLGLSS